MELTSASQSPMLAHMEVHPEAKKGVKLYDHMGRPWTDPLPKVLSATLMKQVYYKGPARVGLYDNDGKSGDPIREELVRAQIPYVVHLLVYNSKFEIAPTRREYYVYASMEVQKAAELALRLWQRWERPPRPEFLFGDMREMYPKVDDGIVAIPMADEDYASHWKDVRGRRHRAAGNPDDPFAFTCLDQDVMIYKAADFQEGLAVKF
jgi:hypothetical protein